MNESRYKSDLSRYRIKQAGRMTGKVLDVGGGLGAYIPYFGSKDVTVIDISEEALTKLKSVQTVLGDACHLPFPEATFDSIWACSVCMYLNEDISVFIKEQLRVLKEGGLLLIELPNPASKWNVIKRIIGMNCWEKDSAIKNMYKEDQLRKYGTLTGEVRFLPVFMDKMIRNRPFFWHTFFLEVTK